MRFLVVACLCLSLGCKPREGATTPRPARLTPVDVSWTVLVRDHSTATKYTGVLVRVRLEPGDYECSGGTIRVWCNDRNVPPAVVFVLPHGATADGDLIVTGVCSGPHRDGVHRSRYCDFTVTVTECAISRP